MTVKVTEDIQLEVLLIFGHHMGPEARDTASRLVYWRAVWDHLHARYPHIAPTKEYPLKWKNNVEHEIGMQTLRELHDWQRRRLHEQEHPTAHVASG